MSVVRGKLVLVYRGTVGGGLSPGKSASLAMCFLSVEHVVDKIAKLW